MKIKFDQLSYQDDAVKSATDVFNAQEIKYNNFTVLGHELLGSIQTEVGLGNGVSVSEDSMLTSVQSVQFENGLTPVTTLNPGFPQFNIEMETGTGKTFVYFKTILELNKKYGFTKFVILVPSVAILEGVRKTYEITKDFFKSQYDGAVYNAFVYNSDKSNDVHNFAASSNIEIMIINIQKFNRYDTKFKQPTEKLEGVAPIELVQQTNPILIIDEPQSTDNTDNAKAAIRELNPSVAFRYSATHRDKSYPLIYRLGPVEAYDQELVKQIVVSSIEADADGNEAYMRLISTDSKKQTAKLGVYKFKKGAAGEQAEITVKKGDNIALKTKLSVYDDYGDVQDIDFTRDDDPNTQAVHFTTQESLTMASQNTQDENAKRLQIRNTIRNHLNKELYLNPKGINVLSLFFIDEVAKYRASQDEDAELGEYGRWFEEEYERLIAEDTYKNLRDRDVPVREVHNGYFSVDKTGAFKNSKVDKFGNNKATKDDESTFENIMKNKEGLLTFYDEEKGNTSNANKLRFIWSHSALKEGWDNPNVFQIATLVETKDTITKRQKIGRGLCIAVNQDGQRVPGFDVNTLTVMANESYEKFATDLQKEYEDDGVEFGKFEDIIFTKIERTVVAEDGTESTRRLTVDESTQLVNELVDTGYVSSNRKATSKLQEAVQRQTIELSDEFSDVKAEVLRIAEHNMGRVPVKRDMTIKDVPAKLDLIKDPNFLELWNHINKKTTYEIHFDENQFVHLAVARLKQGSPISRVRYTTRMASIKQTEGGIVYDAEQGNGTRETVAKAEYDLSKFDILTYLQNETGLTRRIIARILNGAAERVTADLKMNPVAYEEYVGDLLNELKENHIAENIVYKMTDEEWDAELFKSEPLRGVVEGDMPNMVPVSDAKTPYAYVRYDSKIEKKFAEASNLDNNVKYFIKLPSWFKISTPTRNYNPDWAVLKEINGDKVMHFVAETKGTIESELTRPERVRIQYGREHFRALGRDGVDVEYRVVTDENQL
ncbi:restriction endonuclease [Leuconostoc mesenteroides]|uniref:restriction endonuclease n=1 Tax=Leuconostoc mesenteroides TaxID=1245 RepID=UPI0021A2D9DB|nr:DEAD/DEAH box helicase family protein [Leuconostoc mesenteroides]MCT3050459.1 restriction endonuclease subunit R [Leuconostoc mesenteroides]